MLHIGTQHSQGFVSNKVSDDGVYASAKCAAITWTPTEAASTLLLACHHPEVQLGHRLLLFSKLQSAVIGLLHQQCTWVDFYCCCDHAMHDLDMTPCSICILHTGVLDGRTWIRECSAHLIRVDSSHAETVQLRHLQRRSETTPMGETMSCQVSAKPKKAKEGHRAVPYQAGWMLLCQGFCKRHCSLCQAHRCKLIS